MAQDEDDAQRTEEPTQKRLDEAEKQGQVIFSREITSFLIMVAMTWVVGGMAGTMFKKSHASLRFYVDHFVEFSTDRASLHAIFAQALTDGFVILLIPALSIIVVVFFSSIMQNQGFKFTPSAIMPKMERISISKGLGRLFSSKSIVEFLKGLVKIGIVSWVVVIAVSPQLPNVYQSHMLDTLGILALLSQILTRMLIGVCIALFFIAVLDYLYQRLMFYKQLRMTRHEVKEEMKQTEGNPEIKAKLRSIRMNRARKRMMAAVPQADVVITNPTHFSIALRYDPATMQAPIVVAKGIDEIALIIREVAKEHDIPLFENPPLARALFDSAEIDKEIPVAHYQAVAEVISYVFNLKKKKFN